MEELKIAVAVFVKTPGVSSVKTRLAKKIGKERAEDFFSFCIKIMDRTLSDLEQEFSGLQAFWAVAEIEAIDHPLWSAHRRIAQKGEGLGERLHSVYQELKDKFDVVVFMGADSPQIGVEQLREALKELENGASFVFGPTEDGGFYLFAGTAPVECQIWTSVKYSNNGTLQELSSSLQPKGSISYIGRELDVDHYEDLVALAESHKEFSQFLM